MGCLLQGMPPILRDGPPVLLWMKGFLQLDTIGHSL